MALGRIFFKNLPLNESFFSCETIQTVCTNDYCSNHGICYIDATTGISTLKCTCYADYTGTNCQTAINTNSLCSQNPCGSNGTCITISNSSYYCLCPNGVIGQSCSSSISHKNHK